MKTIITCLFLLTALNTVAMGEQNSTPINHHNMLSANEMQFVLTDGINKIMDNPEIGNVSVLDFSTFPPQKTDIANVPCSVTGPPVCIAITPNNELALVTASMKLAPKNKTWILGWFLRKKQVPDNRLSVIDLNTKKVIDTLTVGNKPSGISITPDGKTAILCNRDDGSLTSLEIDGTRVTVFKTLKVAKPEDSLSHIAIAPNSDYALATLNLDNSVIKVKLENGHPTKVTEKITVGTGPYCIDFTPDGNTAIVANVNGANVTILDLSQGGLRKTDTIFTGILPEGLDISPDGRWAIVSCMGYTLNHSDDSMRQEYGQLVLLEKKAEHYSIAQRLKIDRIPQAAVFTADSKYVVIGSFESKRLRIYKLSTSERLIDTGIIIPVSGQPCALRISN